LSTILPKAGPLWLPRKRAVVFAYTGYHRGGLQAVTAALRRNSGLRWSEH
jgi:hypothetical protein